MPDRVIVFIDAQNAYRTARYAFFDDATDPHPLGQFNPVALTNLILSKDPRSTQRILKEVRIYTGRPSATKDPKSHSAHMKQCAHWEAAGAIVIPRPLRYPANWPQEKAREKGIDVRLAIDFVTMAIDDKYDIGILLSVDSDLIPALEYVALNLTPAKTVEVVAWSSPEANRQLRVRGKRLWCHWLDLAAYNTIADPTNYAV